MTGHNHKRTVTDWKQPPEAINWLDTTTRNKKQVGQNQTKSGHNNQRLKSDWTLPRKDRNKLTRQHKCYPEDYIQETEHRRNNTAKRT